MRTTGAAGVASAQCPGQGGAVCVRSGLRGARPGGLLPGAPESMATPGALYIGEVPFFPFPRGGVPQPFCDRPPLANRCEFLWARLGSGDHRPTAFPKVFPSLATTH